MKIITTILFCILINVAVCQEDGRMETDRPDQTESPFIVKPHYIQTEFGFNIERSGSLTTLVHPTALWKYGLNKNLEFRLITQVNSEEVQEPVTNKTTIKTGLLPVVAGGKLRLCEEKGWLPKTSVIAHITIPAIASAYYRASRYAPEFRLAMQHTLSEHVGLGYNIGAEWSTEEKNPFWIYTFGPGFNIGERGYFYVELFGEFHKGLLPSNNFDAGLGYYLSDNAKLDISSGFNLNKSDFYIAAGFSLRFKAF